MNYKGLIECRNKNELKEYFSRSGKILSEKEIKLLKSSFDNEKFNGCNLSLDQLKNIAGGWEIHIYKHEQVHQHEQKDAAVIPGKTGVHPQDPEKRPLLAASHSPELGEAVQEQALPEEFREHFDVETKDYIIRVVDDKNDGFKVIDHRQEKPVDTDSTKLEHTSQGQLQTPTEGHAPFDGLTHEHKEVIQQVKDKLQPRESHFQHEAESLEHRFLQDLPHSQPSSQKGKVDTLIGLFGGKESPNGSGEPVQGKALTQSSPLQASDFKISTIPVKDPKTQAEHQQHVIEVKEKRITIDTVDLFHCLTRESFEQTKTFFESLGKIEAPITIGDGQTQVVLSTITVKIGITNTNYNCISFGESFLAMCGDSWLGFDGEAFCFSESFVSKIPEKGLTFNINGKEVKVTKKAIDQKITMTTVSYDKCARVYLTSGEGELQKKIAIDLSEEGIDISGQVNQFPTINGTIEQLVSGKNLIVRCEKLSGNVKYVAAIFGDKNIMVAFGEEHAIFIEEEKLELTTDFQNALAALINGTYEIPLNENKKITIEKNDEKLTITYIDSEKNVTSREIPLKNQEQLTEREKRQKYFESSGRLARELDERKKERKIEEKKEESNPAGDSTTGPEAQSPKKEGKQEPKADDEVRVDPQKILPTRTNREEPNSIGDSTTGSEVQSSEEEKEQGVRDDEREEDACNPSDLNADEVLDLGKGDKPKVEEQVTPQEKPQFGYLNGEVLDPYEIKKRVLRAKVPFFFSIDENGLKMVYMGRDCYDEEVTNAFYFRNDGLYYPPDREGTLDFFKKQNEYFNTAIPYLLKTDSMEIPIFLENEVGEEAVEQYKETIASLAKSYDLYKKKFSIVQEEPRTIEELEADLNQNEALQAELDATKEQNEALLKAAKALEEARTKRRYAGMATSIFIVFVLVIWAAEDPDLFKKIFKKFLPS